MWIDGTFFPLPVFAPEGGTGGEPAVDDDGGAPPPDIPDDPADIGQPDVSWRDFVSDDKLRPTAEKYNSVDDLLVAYNRMGGELRNRVKVPGQDATEEDRAAWNKAVGVPDTPDRYYLSDREDDYEYTESDLDTIEDMKEWAHDFGIPAPAFDALVQDWVTRTQEIKEHFQKEIDNAAEESQQELYTRWGPDYEKNINNAGLAAQTFGGDDFIEFLDETKIEGFGRLGDHPQIVEFMSKIGAMTAEGEIMLGTSNPQEQKTAQARVDEIMRDNPPGTSGYAHHAAELDDLFKKIAGNKPIGDR